jgi:hypothetical protein
MPIKFTETSATFEAKCNLNEADALYEWLKLHPNGKLDLRHCVHLHTGILQILMIANRTIEKLPEDRYLLHCLQYIQATNTSP